MEIKKSIVIYRPEDKVIISEETKGVKVFLGKSCEIFEGTLKSFKEKYPEYTDINDTFEDEQNKIK